MEFNYAIEIDKIPNENQTARKPSRNDTFIHSMHYKLEFGKISILDFIRNARHYFSKILPDKVCTLKCN
jgi:hypothetical protein